MGARLFVGNLSYQVDDNALRQEFEQFGQVVSAEVVRDRFDGRSRGYGFVEMATSEDAERAIGELNGKLSRGRTMRVEAATSKRRGARGAAQADFNG